jgi:hypothetical protein
MENFPMNNSEKAPVDRQEVINRLKDYGIEDAVTKELLVQYIEQLQAGLEESAGSPERSMEILVNASIATAKMYEDAGLDQEAFDELNDARPLARNAKLFDVVRQIDLFMDGIEERINPNWNQE